MGSWALRELVGADLGDARLNERLVRLAERLGKHPEASIPQACGSLAETKAAYRFWDNDAVSPQAILEPHRRRTIQRASEHEVVLAVQDSTEVNLSGLAATEGLGYLSRRGARGLMVHSVLCVAGDGTPLGLLDQWAWARPAEDLGQRRTRHQRVTSAKESQRWLDGLAAVERCLPHQRCVVVVGDRESDLFDLFAAPRSGHIHLLVRTRDRRRRVVGPIQHLGEAVAAGPPRAQTVIEVPRGDDRTSRRAVLSLRWTRLTVRRPANHPRHDVPGGVELSFLEAREEAPPAGATPLSWLLATTLPVDTPDQALAALAWYAYRWRIERFHYVLKSGCGLERHQLGARERWERLLATLSIVAWHVLHLAYEARRQPQALCTCALSADQWKVLHLATRPQEPVPTQPPTIEQAMRDCAKLGGYLARKRDGPPGVKTLWRGWRRLADLVAGYRLALDLSPPNDSSEDYG
jgi:hypothetical protein